MNGFMLGAGLSCVVSSGLNGVSERGLELAAVGLGGVEKSRIRFTGGGSLSVVIGGRGSHRGSRLLLLSHRGSRLLLLLSYRGTSLLLSW